MKLIKTTLAALITTVLLVGCEEKSPEEIAFEHQRELLRMQLESQEEIARLEVRKAEAENQVSHTYIENEYEYEIDGFREEVEEPVPVQPSTVHSGDNMGYDGSDVLLAAAGGAAAGYIAREVLDNGYRRVVDSSGNEHYYDSKDRKISRFKFQDYKRSKHLPQKESRNSRNGTRENDLRLDSTSRRAGSTQNNSNIFKESKAKKVGNKETKQSQKKRVNKR